MLEHIKAVMQEIIKREYLGGDAGGGATVSYTVGEIERESIGGYKYIGVVIEEKVLADDTVINTELEDKIILSVKFDPE